MEGDEAVRVSLEMLENYDIREVNSSLYSRLGGKNLHRSSIPFFIRQLEKNKMFNPNKSYDLRKVKDIQVGL